MNNTDNIPTVYDPKTVEDKWYNEWEKNNYFHAVIDNRTEPYTIVIPPPNVTGQLHMGHALNNTMQDILIRFKRMQGYSTLWLPGTDHAGIATEAKVKEQIAQDGLSKYDIGRDKFLEKAWQWKEKYGGTITNQLKKLGTSCDWARERFTMDEGCSKAVQEVFVRLYNKGLIYRGDYIINWCPTCKTTLSDIEVEHEEKDTNLWYIKYKIKDTDKYVVAATTRPETMLGDTGIAVNPEDERYKNLIGKIAILPILNREIPIFADSYVDQEYGTGVVKVTPAHDPNDFDMALRNNLDRIIVINDDGKMNINAGKFKGMERHKCRNALVEELKATGLLEKQEDISHSVGHCYRCDATVEPLISKQWFVKMKPLAKPAIGVVEEDKIKFIPKRFEKTYINWLEDIKDWCISRQLWWGHRIPAWYCEDCNEITVSVIDVNKCSHCNSSRVNQDPDVLDTWFSSALWPFSTLGWPEETDDLKYFYPTSVLVTGYDIIFFWVARMIFSGLEFMKEIPFEDVVVTGLVRDAEGRKMSKSLGNGIDPLEVIQEYGADTLRFTLSTGNTPGNDLRFNWDKVEASRNFANKIWNASRFVLMNLNDYNENEAKEINMSIADKWIVSRCNTTIAEVTKALNNYEFGIACQKIYDFFWSEYCDWYIEMAKTALYKGSTSEKTAAQYTLKTTLDKILRLLHPIMPFISEEIWQHISNEFESIVISKWPESKNENYYKKEEEKINIVMDTIRNIRNIRSEMDVAPSKKAEAVLRVTSKDSERSLKEGENYIMSLANISKIEFVNEDYQIPDKAMTSVISGGEVIMPLEGLVDIKKEQERLKKEKENLQKELKRVNGKLSNDGFLSKAPKNVIDKEKDKKFDYEEKLQKVEYRLELIS